MCKNKKEKKEHATLNLSFLPQWYLLQASLCSSVNHIEVHLDFFLLTFILHMAYYN